MESFQSARLKSARVGIPDFPQLEPELINSAQCLPVAEQSARSFAAWVKLDHKLLDVRQTSRTCENCVERTPFRTLDIYLQNVNRCLRHSKKNYSSIHLATVKVDFQNYTRRAFLHLYVTQTGRHIDIQTHEQSDIGLLITRPRRKWRSTVSTYKPCFRKETFKTCLLKNQKVRGN